MANITQNVITSPLTGTAVTYVSPTSATASEDFTFALNDSDDNILFLLDASGAASGSFTVSFTKGGYISGKAASATVTYGNVSALKLSSGELQGTTGAGAFTLTTTATALANSGVKFALIKQRFVTAH